MNLDGRKKRIKFGATLANGRQLRFFADAEFKENTWHYFAFVLDTKKQSIDAFFDGKKTATHNEGGWPPSSELSVNTCPITILADAWGEKAKTIFIDFLRISKSARTEEEITDITALATFATRNNIYDPDYPVLIETRSGERYVCKLDKDTILVESKFGVVNVETQKISKIALCEYRQSEAEEMIKNGTLSAQDVKDEFTGTCLYLKAWIKEDSIKANTRYGKIQVATKAIKNIYYLGPVWKESGELTAILTDGSILKCKLSLEEIEVNTERGKISVPVTEIITLKLDELDTLTTSKHQFRFKLTEKDLEIQTQIGKIKLPRKDICILTSEIENKKKVAKPDLIKLSSIKKLVEEYYKNQEYKQAIDELETVNASDEDKEDAKSLIELYSNEAYGELIKLT